MIFYYSKLFSQNARITLKFIEILMKVFLYKIRFGLFIFPEIVANIESFFFLKFGSIYKKNLL